MNFQKKACSFMTTLQELCCIELINTVCCSQETGRKSLAAPAVGDFQLTSSKRKKYLRQSSSKRRKLNHKRDLQEKNVIDKSTEELKTDEGESESNDNEVERKCEVSDFFNKMSAWSGLGIASSILKALAEQGFEKPTEIQVRFRNKYYITFNKRKYCVRVGFLTAVSIKITDFHDVIPCRLVDVPTSSSTI
jgi:hypothetical protein